MKAEDFAPGNSTRAKARYCTQRLSLGHAGCGAGFNDAQRLCGLLGDHSDSELCHHNPGKHE